MPKQFGAVQNDKGQWQLHYLNSWRGVTKNLCYGGVDGESHDHPTIAEAEACPIALSRIREESKPEAMEKPQEYVALVSETTTEDLADDVAIEAEIVDDNESHEEE